MTTPVLKARNCRWIPVPGTSDERGQVNFLQVGRGLDFEPKRVFWLHHVPPGQWRGRHGHRESQLVLFAAAGCCRVHLDDGTVKETTALDDPTRALYIAPWTWHELTDFAPGTAIMIVASSLYDEADYLRDYQTFRREVVGRAA